MRVIKVKHDVRMERGMEKERELKKVGTYLFFEESKKYLKN